MEFLRQRAEHPLENIVILHTLLPYCCNTFEGAKTVRLVNSTWKRESEQEWLRYTVPVQYLQDEELEEENLENIVPSKLSNVVGKSRAPKNVILSVWDITDTFFDNSKPPSRDVTKVEWNRRFWRAQSRNIAILTLEDCRLFDHRDLLHPAQFLWTELPNLEKLTLVKCILFTVVERKLMHWIISSRSHRLEIPYDKPKTSIAPGGTSISASETDMLPSENEIPMRRVILDKLTLDCSQLMPEMVQEYLNPEVESLQELRLYGVPIDKPNSTFSVSLVMPNLSELHLWGNLYANLEFLTLTPNLGKLVWNINGYDRKIITIGIQEFFESGEYPKDSIYLNENVIEKTTDFEANFKIESINTLEMDWRMTLECWSKLQSWFPNLRHLKARISNDDELFQVAKLWPGLEHLELGHGSNVSACGIFELLFSQNSLPNLKKFIWKGCGCTMKTMEEEGEEGCTVKSFLADLVGFGMELPWVNQASLKDEYDTGCLQALFENAVNYEESRYREEYFYKMVYDYGDIDEIFKYVDFTNIDFP